MKVVSLYSGILGLDIAAHAAGFETVAACDSEPFCQQAITHYLPHVPLFKSDTEVTSAGLQAVGVDPNTITAVIGGPPCQDASIAGRRDGQTGERWRWPQYLRVVNEIKPRWFVAENPKGILSVNKGAAYKWLLSEMAEMGYLVAWCGYGAKDVGSPHQRDRIFIIGRLADTLYEGSQKRRLSGRPQPQNAPTPDSRSPLAHSQSIGWGERRPESAGPEGGFSSPIGRPPLAYSPIQPTREPIHETDTFSGSGQTRPVPLSRSPRDRAGQHDSPLHPETSAQFGMGSDPYGLSLQLAQFPLFPSGPQEAQKDWEPARLTVGEQYISPRLKALGNAVVPSQAYPVFAAIAEIERQRNAQ